MHVPLVGRRLPLQPPPLLRPRRRDGHAPRPLLVPQGIKVKVNLGNVWIRLCLVERAAS